MEEVVEGKCSKKKVVMGDSSLRKKFHQITCRTEVEHFSFHYGQLGKRRNQALAHLLLHIPPF